jgi:hypothetical protein
MLTTALPAFRLKAHEPAVLLNNASPAQLVEARSQIRSGTIAARLFTRRCYDWAARYSTIAGAAACGRRWHYSFDLLGLPPRGRGLVLIWSATHVLGSIWMSLGTN